RCADGGLIRRRRHESSRSVDLLTLLRTPELRLGDFLLPWGMGIGTIGFLAAWIAVSVMEKLGWTRGIWHLPLFFVALAVFLGSVAGLLLAPWRFRAPTSLRRRWALSPRLPVMACIGDTPRSRGRGTVRFGRISWASRRAWPGRSFKFPSRTTRRSRRAICFLKSTRQPLRRR